jgi:hypothetical protein
MENTSVTSIYKKALHELDIVHEELNRPQEDLVMIAACELVKKSIMDFLTAFLTERGVKSIPDNILEIQTLCTSYDKRFERLDLSPIACLNEEENSVYTYNREDKNLNDYVRTLDQTKDLVTELMKH